MGNVSSNNFLLASTDLQADSHDGFNCREQA